MNNTVLLLDSDNLKKAVETAFYKLNFKPKFEEIILKPNLLCYFKSGSGHITNVSLIRAIISVLIEKFKTGKIYVAESSYINADTKRAFKEGGYLELENEFGEVKLVDLKDEEYENGGLKVKTPKILKNKTLINVPVLKGHPQVEISCAVKNLKGLLHDSDKRNIHRWGLHENLPLLAKLHPEFTIVDATTVTETFGTIFSKKFRFNKIIAGTDMVYVDLAACKLVGIDPEKVEYLKILKADISLPLDFEGFRHPLAKWRPRIKINRVGKVDIHINYSCSKCWDACLEAIKPGHIKREGSIIDKIKALLWCMARKKKYALLTGTVREDIEGLDAYRILCGDCAIKLYDNTDCEFIKGCPPDPEEIRKRLI